MKDKTKGASASYEADPQGRLRRSGYGVALMVLGALLYGCSLVMA